MRVEDKGGAPGRDRRSGGSRVAGGVFRRAVGFHPIHTASRAENLPEFSSPNTAHETALWTQSSVGFPESSSERSASRPEVEDDGLWDVFLADDLDEEPQPEWGDFWLDSQ
jgi:hypothetical protein